MARISNALAPIVDGKRHPGDIERTRPNPLVAGLVSAPTPVSPNGGAYPSLSPSAQQALQGGPASSPLPAPAAAGGAMPPVPPGPPPGAPVANHDQILSKLVQHFAGQNMQPGEIDRRIATNVAGMHHLGRLLNKRGDITRHDVSKAAVDAVQAGAISNDAAAEFIDHISDTPPHRMMDKLRTVMTSIALASTALAAVKHQQAAPPQHGT